MFWPTYAWAELRRRFGRTIVTALGLGVGVGLVMGIIGVSDGLSLAQRKALAPLNLVGTTVIVTRTVAPETAVPDAASATSDAGSEDEFFGGQSTTSLNASDTQSLLDANSTVLTDLAELGKPGTQFTHDFLVPGTLITFPSRAVSVISSIKDVVSTSGALSLEAVHESGTVPLITAQFKTGGQTLKVSSKPPPLSAGAQKSEVECILKAGAKLVEAIGRDGKPILGPRGHPVVELRANPSSKSIQACLTTSQKSYIQNVVVPEQTISQTISPPTTNTQTQTYTVAGVDASEPNAGLVTKSQIVSGQWFTKTPGSEVLLDTAYASTKRLKVGDTLAINNRRFRIVGLVSPTLAGNVSDIYFDLSTLQSQSSEKNRVNEVLVSVKNASQVVAVAAEIKKALPGADVLTDKSVANQVTGSLANAKKLVDDLGRSLAIVVLVAALLIAGLLTLSSVTKRAREIGTLRAIGWSKGRVVRQIVAETLGIGIVGVGVGIGLGVVISAIVGAVGPSFSVTATGLSVGASSASDLLGESATTTLQSVVRLTAPLQMSTVLLALGGTLAGGLIAGSAGGWRAARLSPAASLRDVG